MATVTGVDIGKELLEALGMSGLEVKEIHIHVVPDDVVKIETVQFMQNDQFDKLKEVFKSYTLMEKDDTNNEEDCRNSPN
jgi:hypothetical protein